MPYSILKYPLDRSGVAATNLIVKEEHAIVGNTQNKIIVMNYGPFFTDGLIVYDQYGNPLNRGSQYLAANLMADETASTGKEVCGYLIITDSNVKNKVFVTHQLLGGPYSLSVQALQDAIATLNLDNRTISWGDIIAKPELFKPGSHFHDVGDVYGFEYVVLALTEIADAIDRAAGSNIIDLTPITQAIATMQASLKDYLKITDANTTFLTIANAATTYLKMSDFNTTVNSLKAAVGGMNSIFDILTPTYTIPASPVCKGYLYDPTVESPGTITMPPADSPVYATSFAGTLPTIYFKNQSFSDVTINTPANNFFWMRKGQTQTSIKLNPGQSVMFLCLLTNASGNGAWAPIYGSGTLRTDDYYLRGKLGVRGVFAYTASVQLDTSHVGAYTVIYNNITTPVVTLPSIADLDIGESVYVKNGTFGLVNIIPKNSDSSLNMLTEGTATVATLQFGGFVRFTKHTAISWLAVDYYAQPVRQADLNVAASNASTALTLISQVSGNVDTEVAARQALALVVEQNRIKEVNDVNNLNGSIGSVSTSETNHYNELKGRLDAINLAGYLNGVITGTKLINTNNGLCNQCVTGAVTGNPTHTWSLYQSGATVGLSYTTAQCVQCTECWGGTAPADCQTTCSSTA